MNSITHTTKFREPEKIVDDIINEAELFNYYFSEIEKMTFKEVLLNYLNHIQQHDNLDLRGPIFEQIMRFSGPIHKDIDDYNPINHSLEEVKVYSEKRKYNNGDSNKDVDIVFFPACSEGFQWFLAYELKVNLNNFIKSIFIAIESGQKMNMNNNYQKLMYLKKMRNTFNDIGLIGICYLSDLQKEVHDFIKEHFNDLILCNPLFET